MSARAANILVQQALQRQQTNSKHYSSARLFGTGVVMAMTCDYCVDATPILVQDSFEPLWRANIHCYAKVAPFGGRRCIPYLTERGFLKRQDGGKIELLVNDQSVAKITDLRDLLVLNQYLTAKVAHVIEEFKASGSSHPLADSVERVLKSMHSSALNIRNALNEVTAVRLLRSRAKVQLVRLELLETNLVGPQESSKCDSYHSRSYLQI
eukprot:Blabericola_migrator_1__2657@NODE_1753_length_3855_cov_6_151267_g1130_i0_p2_GENE_NODE_1753_length_3855_cov_6_151267_g1130_i0NODE_1753_length_3855_cov_6_151267_g1130_i0_p2_ORF_typecomplete_len210_score28_78_NODE_1753_length_3855_cov_6_151267_g1130_i023442973